MRIKKLVRCVISLPKSIYFCFRYLPFNQAIRIPILIAYDTNITQMRGGGINKFLKDNNLIVEGILEQPFNFKRVQS